MCSRYGIYIKTAMMISLNMFALISCSDSSEQGITSDLHNILSGDSPNWKMSDNILFSNIFELAHPKLGKLGNSILLNANSEYILTNAHVAGLIKYCSQIKADCDSFTARSFNGNEIKLKNIRTLNVENDFSTISFSWVHKGYVSDIRRGYEYSSVKILSLLDNSSIESHASAVFESDRFTLYRCDSVKGMSGSPVFNEKDEFIGIHKGFSEKDNLNIFVPINLINLP